MLSGRVPLSGLQQAFKAQSISKYIEQVTERVTAAKRDVKNSDREQDRRLQQRPDLSNGGVCHIGFYFIINIVLSFFL